MTTRLDTLPLEIQQHIYDLARPVCGDCHHPYDNTFAHSIHRDCACEFCEGCLLEALWLHTGCDTSGERDSFVCHGCGAATIDIALI